MMSLFRIFVPGIGVMIVRAADSATALQAATTAATNLGVTGQQPQLQGNINSPSEIGNFAGGWLINQQGAVITQLSNVGSESTNNIINQFVNGQFDQGQNQIEETVTPTVDPQQPAGPGSGPASYPQQQPTTVVTQPETPPGTGFNPQEGVGVTFGPNVLTEALRSIGVDTSRPGQSFLGSLFPQVQAAESIRSLLGIPTTGGAATESPFANFAINTLGGGGQALGQSSLEALRALAQMGGNQTYSGFNSPTSLGTNEAQSVRNLAEGALLSRLSPTAFSLFGNQLVGNAANQFGNQVATGNAPINFAQHFLNTLGL